MAPRRKVEMIGNKIKAMLEDNGDFLIPADRVANVQVDNNLDHALLVLTNIGYTIIPVLDHHGNIKGLISMPVIMKAITGLKDIHFDHLSDLSVSEVMKTDFAQVEEDYELEDVLHLLVDNPFVCVTDDSGSFKGIITRKVVLAATNRLAHEFENLYEVQEKAEQLN